MYDLLREIYDHVESCVYHIIRKGLGEKEVVTHLFKIPESS